MKVVFRPALDGDWSAIWPIFTAVVAGGDTYAYSPDTGFDEGRRLWMEGDDREVFVVLVDDEVAGSAYLRPNQPGLGDHVANAGWMIGSAHRGLGLGRRFAEYVIEEARAAGYQAMQFNAVVASNEAAVRLWQSLGLEIVGTVPDAFRHTELGPTAVHVMYRSL
jgi:L-amino acid N-acyltransferase YncA